MQAAVLKNDKEMIVSEVPMPTFGPGQVLIRVNWSSICGTDLHNYTEVFELKQLDQAFQFLEDKPDQYLKLLVKNE